MYSCNSCGMMMQTGWVACPYCGVQVDNVFNSSKTVIELAENRCRTGCSSPCSRSKKKIKETCCGKHERKNKFCKSCPERPERLQRPCTSA